MGCFLACFGFTKKRRRPKGSTKNVPGDQSCGKYVPLDSDVTLKLDCDEMQNSSATKFRDNKAKELTKAKMKKKVRFNLNVKTYERLPNDEISTCISEGEEKTMWEYNQEETAGESMKYLNYEGNLMGSKFGLFPPNYRYQNCRDGYDEEDEIELEESDVDDDDDADENDLDFDEDDIGKSYNYNSNSASVEEGEKVTSDQLADEKRSNRSQNVHLSVLTPVENLTQWKEVKAKPRQQLKHQKEIIMSEQAKHLPSLTKKSSNPLALISSEILNHCNPRTQEVAVDASLSNWLVSSRTELNAKNSIAAIGEWNKRRSRWMHQTHLLDKMEQY
ncbi:hypothetical protein ACH5RR_032957 [Cinchona calisaya]|uniref:Uncharacterized protein n=1 Tax=Cinchona calisaya TaxID=153742 RepID=A0ABD2YJL5_9GENT